MRFAVRPHGWLDAERLRKLWHAVGCHLGATKIAGVLAQQPRYLDRAVRASPGVRAGAGGVFLRRGLP
jgi:hypothetical protein